MTDSSNKIIAHMEKDEPAYLFPGVFTYRNPFFQILIQEKNDEKRISL